MLTSHRPPKRLARLPLLVVPVALAAAAPTREPAPPERTIDIVATEYAFAAPDTVVAGRTRIRMTSRGSEPHIVEIARLEGGHTAEDLVAEMMAQQVPSWATWIGGPLVPPPNGASEVTVELAPGRYVLVCPIPTPADRKHHMEKGMVRTLIVVPAPKRSAPERRAERAEVGGARDARGDSVTRALARAILVDYGFKLEPAWSAGRYTFRVENDAAQPHEVVVMRLAPGKHVADVLGWVRSLVGPPPGEFVGGTTSVTKGNVVEFEATLAPGDYALLCFARDAKDGRSHTAHGMTREVTVR